MRRRRVLLESIRRPITYYADIRALLSSKAETKKPGDSISVDIAGRWLRRLRSRTVRLEPAKRLPPKIGGKPACPEASPIRPTGTTVYAVTDTADGQVVLHANHPWAGSASRRCRYSDVRSATAEVEHGTRARRRRTSPSLMSLRDDCDHWRLTLELVKVLRARRAALRQVGIELRQTRGTLKLSQALTKAFRRICLHAERQTGHLRLDPLH